MTTPNTRIEPLSYHTRPDSPYVGEVSVLSLAQTYGTPLYVLDGATFTTMAGLYQDTLQAAYPAASLPLYAAKANLCTGLARKLDALGLGMDVVSGGELYTARRAGFPMDRVWFNGNNKSADELALALEARAGCITVDNLTELALLANVARQSGHHARIMLRITPGIDCHTHDYIRTGQVDSKFGLNLSDVPTAVTDILTTYADCLTLTGLHAHIGSQIFEQAPYLDLAATMLDLYQQLRQQHNGLVLTDLNLGGGLGIAYTAQDDPLPVDATLRRVADAVQTACHAHQYPLPRLLMEPGRSLIATAGITLYTLGSVKEVPGIRTYIAVDGGMGDNIRPSLYQARYTAVVANRLAEPATRCVTIAGKYCESGDILIRDLMVPDETMAGDILIVFGTGAYNYSMASVYNRMPRPTMLWVADGRVETLVRRETYADLCRLDII